MSLKCVINELINLPAYEPQVLTLKPFHAHGFVVRVRGDGDSCPMNQSQSGMAQEGLVLELGGPNADPNYNPIDVP